MTIPSIPGLDTSGESLRRLDDKDTTEYLSRLNNRLANLSEILRREGEEYVLSYLNIVRNSIHGLILKHELSGHDKIDFSLTIAPFESGFPTPKDFYYIERDKDQAQSVLETIGSNEEAIDRIRGALFRGESPLTPQIILRRRKFYSQLAEKPVLSDYHLNEPKQIKVENNRRLYTLEWSCLERGTNRPVFYRMCLTQDMKYLPLENCPDENLQTIIYSTQWGLDLKTLASLTDREIAEVHPKLVTRYTIGPYYNTHTKNSSEMDKLLAGQDDPAILKFTVEKVLSQKVQEHGSWWDALMGRKTERELFGPVDKETKMIVPFRLKQHLGNHDEFGNYCRVYGVTDSGEVIG